MNRLGIFMIYDEQGKIDRYIGYLLDNISHYLDRLILVCNGTLSVDGRRYLEQFSNEIIVRDNVGFDFGAWKDVMVNYLGFVQIAEYDELILFNDSFFGPFTDFGEIFEKMESQDLDFWGLSVHGEVNTVKNMCPYGYRPRYIQTYFLAFQKRMLSDYSFINYWKNMPNFTQFLEAGEKGSAVLTHYFEQLGFRWNVYSDTTEWEESREKNICQHAFNTYDLITEKQYPIIKRKSFVLGKNRFLKYNTGRDLPKALEYIKKNTQYNTDLIYEHLIRKFHISDLKESMNLDFILPTTLTYNNDKANNKLSLLVIVEFEKGLEINESIAILKYLSQLSNELDIIVICPNDAIQKIKEENFGIHFQVFGSNENSFFIQNIPYSVLYEYDYVCILNPIVISKTASFVVGKSASEAIIENLLFSSDYINNIISIFEQNKYIGLLAAPPFLHGDLLGVEQVKWLQHYDHVLQLFNYLELEAIIEPQKTIPITDNAIWFKPTILKKLYKLTENPGFEFDNQDIHLLYPYLAQDSGFLTGTCMADIYASTEYESLNSILNNIMSMTKNKMGLDFDSVQSLISGINQYISHTNKLKKENSKLKKAEPIINPEASVIEVPVEVPVLVDIGVRGALKNWFRKKFGIFAKKES